MPLVLSSANLKTLEQIWDYILDGGIDAFCKAIDWDPHPGQHKWLHAPKKSTNVLITGRRWGKSESSGVGLLYKALTHPKYRACIVSVTLDQARLSWDIAASYALGHPIIKPFVKRVAETPFPTIEFLNGSFITVRTTARNGIYIRGHHFHDVEADEADYITEAIFDDVIKMTLADYNGKLTLRSTPRRKAGFVYKELQKGLENDPEVYSQVGSTFENPNISHEYINNLKRKMTQNAWLREVEGKYVDDDLAVFRWEDIMAAYENAEWNYNLLPRDRSKLTGRYVAGWDLAKSQDWTVGTVLDTAITPNKVVYYERFNRQAWPLVTEKMRKVHQAFDCKLTLFDATGLGTVVSDLVNDFAEPFVFTKQSKSDIIMNLQVKLEKRKIKFPFVKQMVDELQEYEWDDDELTTDTVMSLALSSWAADYYKSRGLVTW